jgi:hypothetical protein
MTNRRDARHDSRYEMASRRAPERRPGGRRAAPEPRSGFRLSPGPVILVIAIVLSVVYAFYAVTVRDTSQIPMLASGAVVVGIAFGAFAIYTLSALWRAGLDGRGGRAILLGFVGGGAAIVAAGCMAGAVVLFLLSTST